MGLSAAELRLQVEEQMERGRASKRAREVARIILERGACTTTDLEELGYKHPPRAVKDLKDAGIEIRTITESYVDPSTGNTKRRAKYSVVGVDASKESRRQFSKAVSDAVKASGKCEVCGALPPLQVDHRVPFDIGGETFPHVLDELMPLCPSCNRSKSWACEHCENWTLKDTDMCRACMWASPHQYDHVAGRQQREIRITLTDPRDVLRFDCLRPDATNIVIEYLRENE
ncbi:MAG: HNH endonuclease [Leucobacter sp.]|nr:HNH endonuclease [Leucobacter sp.]